MEPIISLSNVSFQYKRFDEASMSEVFDHAPALSDISFDLCSGDFLIICGDNGSGKSTLLRLLTGKEFCAGKMSGSMNIVPGIKTGYLMQNPYDQCVTDKVKSELAFALSFSDLPPNEALRRIAEVTAFFNLGSLLERDTATLSGGQLQLVNLAALLTLEPDLLLLDEPVAGLDEHAACEFYAQLERIHRELGITVCLCEHNLTCPIAFADRILFLQEGRPVLLQNVSELTSEIKNSDYLYSFLPTATKFGISAGSSKTVTQIGEARSLMANLVQTKEILPDATHSSCDEPKVITTTKSEDDKPVTLQLKHLFFAYNRKENDVLIDLNATFRTGTVTAILGSNGCGKTTLFKVLSGILSAQEGRIEYGGKILRGSRLRNSIAFLPQNPEDLFFSDDLAALCSAIGAEFASLPRELGKYGPGKHPYDLSGGEKTLLALWMVLSKNCPILLLDEPGRGLSRNMQKKIGEQIRLLAQNHIVLMITHDPEFAAETADECCFLYGGTLTPPVPTERFMAMNRYFTTSAVRISRGITRCVVTENELLSLKEL